MIEIQVKPSEIWEYSRNLYKSGLFGVGDELEETSERVAHCEETMVDIYLTSDRGKPFLIAYRGDERMDKVELQEDTAEAVTEEFYELLVDVPLGEDAGDEIDDAELESREDELLYQSDCFVRACLSDEAGELSVPVETVAQISEKLLDLMGEYLARGWGVSMYRPTKYQDADGGEFIVAYPYECEESGADGGAE